MTRSARIDSKNVRDIKTHYGRSSSFMELLMGSSAVVRIAEPASVYTIELKNTMSMLLR